MKRLAALALVLAAPLAALVLAAPLAAQAPAPSEVVAAAPAGDWVAIAPEDLLVMTLAPDAAGRPRRVVIQLMPPPFSQGWVGNIRTLARAHWWDGLSINRVQDNYVVQWGDAEGDAPERARVLPGGLVTMPESDYAVLAEHVLVGTGPTAHNPDVQLISPRDNYAASTGFAGGWAVGLARGHGRFSRRDLRRDPQSDVASVWPVHCYGMVGVGRGMPPDTGSGAELYAVIGHAPRHLDRNIALIGRVIEGIEHLSSLPRGTGPLGFYETAGERVPIVSIRMGSEVPGLPRFQFLSTDGASFARYADARASRRDAFFIRPAGGADVCNVPVPVRRAQ